MFVNVSEGFGQPVGVGDKDEVTVLSSEWKQASALHVGGRYCVIDGRIGPLLIEIDPRTVSGVLLGPGSADRVLGDAKALGSDVSESPVVASLLGENGIKRITSQFTVFDEQFTHSMEHRGHFPLADSRVLEPSESWNRPNVDAD